MILGGFMDIVHVASELAPIAKVGGLGDVLFGLCRALSENNHRIEVCLPKYDCLALEGIEGLCVLVHDFPSFFDGKCHHNRIWKGSVNGFSVLLFETNDSYDFFDRDTIYGCPDDSDRFLYFNRLVLEYLYKRGPLPDILHVHDWHTAAIPLLQRSLYASLHSPKVILTIHNLAYQGITAASSLQKAGLPETILHTKKEPWNLLGEGIEHADWVTTVSPTYAEEILTPMGGKGLDALLQKHRTKFSGILNGIDKKFWDPKTDPALPFNYSVRDISKESPPFIENKGKAQHYLRHMFSLTEKPCPIVSCITRLVSQKSPDLIKHALFWTLKQNAQFILLGSTADAATHEEFYNIKRETLASSSVHIELTYNEKLSHLIYAASDLLVVPSLFEPCGLTQLIAMRYGAVPLVRKTGGLADTVFDGENGFLFGPSTEGALEEALERALSLWRHEPKKWRRIMEHGMTIDYSWKKSAEEYLALYRKLSMAPAEIRLPT